MSNNFSRKMVRKTERELRNKAFKGAKKRVFSTLKELKVDRAAGLDCDDYPWADVISRFDPPENGWSPDTGEAVALQMMKESRDDFDSGLLTTDGGYISAFDFVQSCKGLTNLHRAMPGFGSHVPTEWEFRAGMFRDWIDEGHADGLSSDELSERFNDFFYAFRFALEQQFNPEFKLSLEEATLLWTHYISYERLVRDVSELALGTLPVQPVVDGKYWNGRTFQRLMRAA